MLALTTRLTADLNAEEREAIVQMCSAAFEEDFSSLFGFLPPDGLHIMAHDGPALVGHAVVTTRWLEVDGGPPLRTAYVDAVATHPAHQRRGVGSAVMRRLATAIADDYAIGALATEAFPFYGSVGWQRWRGPLFARTAVGVVATPEENGVMVLLLPRTPPICLDAPLSIEERPGEVW